MQHTVFISHSVKDVDKDAAERVYSYLVRNGIRCFMDTKDLIAGKQYHIQLAEAVKASNIVVLILSSNSDSSEAVGNEIAIARNNRISIIPLRIEDIIPDKLAFFLTTSQWIDAFPPPIENHLPKLVDAIKQHVSGDKLPDSQHFTNDEGETTTQPVSAPVKPSDKITFRIKIIYIL